MKAQSSPGGTISHHPRFSDRLSTRFYFWYGCGKPPHNLARPNGTTFVSGIYSETTRYVRSQWQHRRNVKLKFTYPPFSPVFPIAITTNDCLFPTSGLYLFVSPMCRLRFLAFGGDERWRHRRSAIRNRSICSCGR